MQSARPAQHLRSFLGQPGSIENFFSNFIGLFRRNTPVRVEITGVCAPSKDEEPNSLIRQQRLLLF
jgi:hypothetical protein